MLLPLPKVVFGKTVFASWTCEVIDISGDANRNSTKFQLLALLFFFFFFGSRCLKVSQSHGSVANNSGEEFLPFLLESLLMNLFAILMHNKCSGKILSGDFRTSGHQTSLSNSVLFLKFSSLPDFYVLYYFCTSLLPVVLYSTHMFSVVCLFSQPFAAKCFLMRALTRPSSIKHPGYLLLTLSFFLLPSLSLSVSQANC